MNPARAAQSMRNAAIALETNVNRLFGREFIPAQPDKGAENVYKNGACALLFTSIQVMATGIVNGCACRDANATLRIGDLTTTPLREILSPRNEAYRRLIDEQQRGEFRPICRSCDFYKSIYHKRAKYRQDKPELQTLAEFRARMGAATQTV